MSSGKVPCLWSKVKAGTILSLYNCCPGLEISIITAWCYRSLSQNGRIHTTSYYHTTSVTKRSTFFSPFQLTEHQGSEAWPKASPSLLTYCLFNSNSNDTDTSYIYRQSACALHTSDMWNMPNKIQQKNLNFSRCLADVEGFRICIHDCVLPGFRPLNIWHLICIFYFKSEKEDMRSNRFQFLDKLIMCDVVVRISRDSYLNDNWVHLFQSGCICISLSQWLIGVLFICTGSCTSTLGLTTNYGYT